MLKMTANGFKKWQQIYDRSMHDLPIPRQSAVDMSLVNSLHLDTPSLSRRKQNLIV